MKGRGNMRKPLEIKHLCKSFGDHLALNDITTDISTVDVLCLVVQVVELNQNFLEH